MRRFFVEKTTIFSDMATLNADESRHLARVLRLGAGERVQLFDGDGMVYEGIIQATGERARIQIIDRKIEAATGKPLRIGQAILRGSKMDELIQRYTEFGVDTIIPIWTNHCQGSFDGSKEKMRQARQERIIEAACKQCGRARPPRLGAPLPFADFLAELPAANENPGSRRVLFWEDEKGANLRDISFAGAHEAVALIGPAGGWSAAEVAMARARGFQTARLAGHILRAETAGLAAAALCQFLLRNL
ncbi:MAG: 16S rRNA (uracil(1498)-N(3))-methyltransferase [Desulfobulbaceae bacterium]|nr:16S rRNA (uracil(1498)-N(3))-methyltransferase [Desulfobulbaceae bacterium]